MSISEARIVVGRWRLRVENRPETRSQADRAHIVGIDIGNDRRQAAFRKGPASRGKGCFEGMAPAFEAIEQ